MPEGLLQIYEPYPARSIQNLTWVYRRMGSSLIDLMQPGFVFAVLLVLRKNPGLKAAALINQSSSCQKVCMTFCVCSNRGCAVVNAKCPESLSSSIANQIFVSTSTPPECCQADPRKGHEFGLRCSSFGWSCHPVGRSNFRQKQSSQIKARKPCTMIRSCSDKHIVALLVATGV